jgi:hypothetical protein
MSSTRNVVGVSVALVQARAVVVTDSVLDQLGATSRFQAGLQAARHGWADDQG